MNKPSSAKGRWVSLDEIEPLKAIGKDLESADRANRGIHELNLHLDNPPLPRGIHDTRNRVGLEEVELYCKSIAFETPARHVTRDDQGRICLGDRFPANGRPFLVAVDHVPNAGSPT